MFQRMLLEVQSVRNTMGGLLAYLLLYIKKWLHFRRLATRFPGPSPLPLVGNLLMCGIHDPGTKLFHRLTLDIIPRYRTGQFWGGTQRCIFINDPKDIQCFLRNAKNQSKPVSSNNFFTEVLGNGILLKNGEEWRGPRKAIDSSLHKHHLNNSFIPIFNKKSNIFVKLLSKYADGQTFNVMHMVDRFALDTILETVFGVPSNQQTYPETELFEAIREIHAMLCQRVVRPWLQHPYVFYVSSLGRRMASSVKILRRLPEKVIWQRANILEAQKEFEDTSDRGQIGKKQYHGYIETLLFQMKNGSLTDKDITDEVQTLILAGSETVATTISLALYSLARHPNVQRKVVEELQNVLDENGCCDLTPDMLQSMQYLDMVIKETLRMYPTVWIVMREAGIDTPLVSCDLVIPEGATVLISPKSVHADAALYPRPELFQPERFAAAQCTERHPFAFLPFAAGARGCVGKRFSMMEIKTILCKVLWNYELQPDPSYTPTFTWGITVVPNNGMWIKCVKRNSALGSSSEALTTGVLENES